MMLSFFTGISFTPPFPGETSSWDNNNNNCLFLFFCLQAFMVFFLLHWEKKLCKRDGSGGRVSSGCPGCYLGSIRFYPYNRDVAIIFLPTEYAASFSCGRIYCVWLSSDCIDRDV